MKKQTRRNLLLLLVAAGIGIALTIYFARQTKAEPVLGSFVQVQRGDLVELASVSGTIEPNAQVDIYSRAAGEVTEVLVEEGDTVEEGAVLFRLDPIDANRALLSAQSDVQRIGAALAEAKAQLASSEASSELAAQTASLDARGVELGLSAPQTARQSARDNKVATNDVALRRAQIKSVQAQLQAAKLAVDDAKRTVERMEIRAPFAGTVLSVGVERGSLISSPMSNVSGGTTLLTIADLSDLRVIGQLDEAQVGRVKAGQEVAFRVDAYPEREFRGKVHRVSPLGVVDTNVVVFDVEIVVTDPDAVLLRSGMSADVEIVTKKIEQALLVPLTALRSQGNARMVQLADGSLRKIKTGATNGEKIVVTEGLQQGESIAADGRANSDAPATAPSRSGLLPSPRGRR